MKPLKDIYTHPGVFKALAADMKLAYPALDQKKFHAALIHNLNDLELKARFERAVVTCHEFLPKDYAKALKVLYKFCEGKGNKLIYIFLPTFVAKYGTAHYDISMKAIRDFTEYCTSEEGVRAYIDLNPKKTLGIMKTWTKSKNVHIRRLASEGSRPRLPWAKKVSCLIEKPELAWSILEALNKDPEKYVQKSVANHINDISKDHADWVVNRIKTWDASNPNTAWIIKHGMRTLLKEGHNGALKLFGNHKKPLVSITHSQWDKAVKLNQKAQIHYSLLSNSNKNQELMIDYKIHFIKKNGKQNTKTFKLKKIQLKPKQSINLSTHYTFKNYSTRKHYLGPHAWQFMINGQVLEKHNFVLKA